MKKTTIVLGLLLITNSALAVDNDPLLARADAADGNAAALVAAGNLFVEAQRLDEAKNAYRKALKVTPKFALAEVGLARIEMAKGHFKQAKRKCRAIAKKNKDSAVGELCTGWAWLTNDRGSRAVEEFEKALTKGNKAEAKMGIAEAKRKIADYPQAIAAFKEAISAGSGYYAHIGLGLTYESSRDQKAALAALKKAVSVEPASVLAHYHYARMLGRGTKAVEHLRTALIMRPSWVDAHLALGAVEMENGLFENARAAYQGAIDAGGKRGILYLGLGTAYHKLGKPKKAEEALAEAIKLVPDLADAYLVLAEALMVSERRSEAVEALEKAREIAPGEISVYLQAAKIYMQMGRLTKARTYLKKSIAMKSDLSIAYVLLGDISCERRLYEDAINQYDEALKGDMNEITSADINAKKLSCKSKH